MDLLFLVWEEDSWYVFNCSFMRNLFLAMHCMLLWQIYKGQRWARKIWIFYWICFQIRRMLSRGFDQNLQLNSHCTYHIFVTQNIRENTGKMAHQIYCTKCSLAEDLFRSNTRKRGNSPYLKPILCSLRPKWDDGKGKVRRVPGARGYKLQRDTTVVSMFHASFPAKKNVSRKLLYLLKNICCFGQDMIFVTIIKLALRILEY